MAKVRAAVPDARLLRVEACGMCGSDVEQYDLRQFELLDLNSAVVHEPVGYIEEVGAEAMDLVNGGAPAGRSTVLSE
jgi:threonine dehydrogenase-like Zn-dependent dehydrogenase